MDDSVKLPIVVSLVKALEDLLVCYRLGKRPSEKLLDDITELRELLRGEI